MKRTPCIFFVAAVLCLILTLCSCGFDAASSVAGIPSASVNSPADSISEDVPSSEAESKEVIRERDNTPSCLVPEASGEITFTNDVTQVDASHLSEGYLMVRYTGTNSKVKLQLTGPDQITYTYDLNSTDFETFPLSAGSGAYHLAVYQNITGKQYATVFSLELEPTITNTFGPYLYPNQYVQFTKDSEAVKLAASLSASANNDFDVVSAVYSYVTTHITYDYDKAQNVSSGYLPNIDKTLADGKGICLDYASLMVSMLRSQNIPTRMEVGYAGQAYHAWLSTYIKDVGWINGIMEFDGTDWTLMDPTFATTSSEKDLKNFIGDGSNYKTKYIY